MFADAAMLTLQLAVIALIALPILGLVARTSRVDARERRVHIAAAPRAICVAGVSASRVPLLKERVFATTRARSPGR